MRGLNLSGRRPKRRLIVCGAIALTISALAMQSVYATHGIDDGRHWGQGNLSREYVTIVDYTSSAWPVYAAALEWDTAPKLDVVYQYGGCAGSYGHCVGVQIISMADYNNQTCAQSGGFAMVSRYSSTNNHLNPDNTYIRLNGNCNTGSYTNRDRRALACEEEGHVLGLDHAASDQNASTCMASGHITQLYEKPRQHDFDELDSIYTHSH